MPANPDLHVTWLRLALRDISDIVAYVSQDSPDVARTIAARIWQESQGLRALAERGRPGRVPGTRELVLDGLPYFLAYRVKGKTVQILRVIHMAQRWP